MLAHAYYSSTWKKFKIIINLVDSRPIELQETLSLNK